MHQPGETVAAVPMTNHTVCQVLHSLAVGGAEVLAEQLVRQLKERYRFVFACLDGLGRLGEQLRADGFTVEVLGRRPGVDFGCASRLAAFCRRENVRLIQAHQYTPFFYATVARGFRGRPRILYTEHGRFFPDYRRWKRVWFNRLCLRRSDRVVVVGECLRKVLVDNEGIAPSRIDVIYNGVNPGGYSPEVDRITMRARLGVDKDQVLLVQVGRLDPIKDHATGVRALARVLGQRRDVHLAIAGEGPEKPQVEAEVDRNRLAGNVHVLGFFPDLNSLLHAADVFLLTSVSEGIPVTILEAMAVGLPVLSTNVGGVAELVCDGETGFLVPSGDPATMAEAMLRLASDRDLRQRLGDAGRKRAAEAFSQRQMHAGYTALYEEMLGE